MRDTDPLAKVSDRHASLFASDADVVPKLTQRSVGPD
jgi:hypothetical protein